MRWKLCSAFAVLLALGAVSLPAQAQAKKSSVDSVLKRQVSGAELFSSYCATCHGADAKGNGPMASQLKSKVPDLTQISARNAGKFPSDRVQKSITGEPSAAHGTREMPVWGPVFSESGSDPELGKARVQALTQYIAKLQKK